MKTTVSTIVLILLLIVPLVSTLSHAIAFQYVITYQMHAGLTIVPNQPVPMFLIGLVLAILFAPVIIYTMWRNKQRKKVLP